MHLPNNPTIADFQAYVEKMVKIRGFDKETIPQIFMLFLEECGEFSKAVRKSQGIKTENGKAVLVAAHEAADVFIYLLDLCNHLEIDLESAFREKEEINKGRIWT